MLPAKELADPPRGSSRIFSGRIERVNASRIGGEASTCTSCDKGKFAASTGLLVCSNCGAGTFSNVTDASAGGQSFCYECPQGSFQSSSQTSFCSLCDAGKYANVTKTQVCSDCPTGLKAPSIGTINCFFIPDGCVPGTFDPINVGPNATAASYNLSRCLPCPAASQAPAVSVEGAMSFVSTRTSGRPAFSASSAPNSSISRNRLAPK